MFTIFAVWNSDPQAVWWLAGILFIGYLMCLGLSYLLTVVGVFACVSHRVALTLWAFIGATALLLLAPFRACLYQYEGGAIAVAVGQLWNIVLVSGVMLVFLLVVWLSYPQGVRDR